MRFTDKAGLIAYLGISGSDNLGNHTATTNLNMAGSYINSAGRVTVT